MANTRTILQTLTWAKFFIGRRPTFLDVEMQPALTSADLITQTIMQPPFKWKWNRATYSFPMIDPAGWQAGKTLSVGYRIIDSNGNMQTVNTQGTTGSNPPTWSKIPGTNTGDNTVVWTESASTDYVQNIPTFGFIEKAQVLSANGVVSEIPDIKQDLTMDAGTGRPQTIAPIIDDGQGNITFRFMPGFPDQLYTATVIFQKKPVLLTSLNSPWQIPDEYGLVYGWGMLFYLFLFSGSSYVGIANQKFMSGLISLSEGLSEQQRMVFLGEWEYLTKMALEAQMKTQQGIQSRV